MKYISTILFLLFTGTALAQQPLADSLRQVFDSVRTDKEKFDVARLLYVYFEELNRDSALHYADVRYQVARKNNRRTEEAYTQGQKGYQLIYLGRFSEALTCLTESLKIINNEKKDPADIWDLALYNTPSNIRLIALSMLNHMFGHLMQQTGNTERQVYYFKEGRRIGLSIPNSFRVTVGDMVLASTYVKLNDFDSALFFAKEGEQYAIKGNIKKYLVYLWDVMGDIYLQKRDSTLSLSYYHQALDIGRETDNLNGVAMSYERLINFHALHSNGDSVLYYALKNLQALKMMGGVIASSAGDVSIGNAYQQLARGYSLQKNLDSATKYQRLALFAKDSMAAIKLKNLADFQRLTLDEQLRLQADKEEQVSKENKIKIGLLVAGIAIVLIITLWVYRNNRQKAKTNRVLQQQKQQLEATLQELKSTQQQLIQSEKMASLGELTAGIAHEIQNPLNFVNNFSEVSRELIDELKNEKSTLSTQEQEEILNDIDTNLEKINHHGKRADAIVKGMLQHSRSGSGQKELTDINALADEYLRLSYHGLRAKDKSFNATFKSDFDPAVGRINIIPQEIGRVIMNLLTNAFYAVDEKKKLIANGQQPTTGIYKPTVSIKTKKEGNNVLISVTDNGNGIPASVIDKIFQPFFTTKPTGQGTGLGLSLSYDIVKAHGGEIRISNGDTGGAMFLISLPVNAI